MFLVLGRGDGARRARRRRRHRPGGGAHLDLAKIPGLGTALQTFPNIDLNPIVATGTFAAGVALGLSAGLLPALAAFRANITAMLRQV